jgi:hypothetical protein
MENGIKGGRLIAKQRKRGGTKDREGRVAADVDV